MSALGRKWTVALRLLPEIHSYVPVLFFRCYPRDMSTKHVRTTGDLVCFGLKLTIDDVKARTS